MQSTEIEQFVMNFLEVTGSRIMEKAPSHVTVKLSPQADKALTNRPYYWSFVERTGATPETMTFTFIFRPDKYKQWEQQQEKKQLQKAEQAASSDSILARYFGTDLSQHVRRVPEEHVHYGASRLQQIFNCVKENGRFVSMYESPQPLSPGRNTTAIPSPRSYETWLGVNYRVEFLCDQKRDELHSLGICLSTGAIAEEFHAFVQQLDLTPKLPVHTHIKDGLSVSRAAEDLHHYLRQEISSYNHSWAEAARERLQDELQRIDSYYMEMIDSLEDEEKAEAEAQYENRKSEIRWQHEPRIEVSVMNCGYFHLLSDPLTRN
ncbi:YqhG family protein [Marinicrinis sediminis]|uniref:YqhG family protein n=1 Tax=Marinicrinis sediminis TaxID=1652465 RepID=A0ABW5R6B5_9BACL